MCINLWVYLWGKGIEVKLSEQNPTYRDFRHAYKNIKYNTLGDTFSGKLDENFEYLFVLFTLGTLLAPSASILVSDRMLKVVTLTKDALGEFDWSSFILEELSQQIHKFNKHSHKSKATKRKTVGGCVYFLMLFCLQNFAFGDKVASEHESAMAYWTDDGINNLTQQPALKFRECEEDDDDRDEEDDDKEIDDEDDEKEIEDEDDDNDKEKDDQDDEKEIEDEDDEKDKEDEDDHIVDIDDEDSHLHDTPIQGERSDGKIRRSKRVITRSSVLKSPWIDPNRKTKGKRQYDEKEQLV
ncbi:hypothetical protein K1719_031090 [Acacia pycnantha]|nr:hypothetical protein K1719_031090 [Acacia pycnantha]